MASNRSQSCNSSFLFLLVLGALIREAVSFAQPTEETASYNQRLEMYY